LISIILFQLAVISESINLRCMHLLQLSITHTVNLLIIHYCILYCRMSVLACDVLSCNVVCVTFSVDSSIARDDYDELMSRSSKIEQTALLEKLQTLQTQVSLH